MSRGPWGERHRSRIVDVRAKLAQRHECESEQCPGWAIFTTDGAVGHKGIEIQRCDVCAADVCDDYDVEMLPEARWALAQAWKKDRAA